MRYIALALLVILPLMADEECFDPDSSQVDIVEPFIVEQRDTPLPCKPGLRISGDVRAAYRHLEERIGPTKVRGAGSATTTNPGGLATAPSRIEFNLNFDYRSVCSWAAVKITYANPMGVINGEVNGLGLQRAVGGYEFCLGRYGCVMGEAGRKPLSDAFTSEILFGARMDGIYGRYQNQFGRVGEGFVQAAGFIVDSRVNYYGWVASIGLEEIGCTGAYVIFAQEDWSHGGQGPGRVFELQSKNTEPLEKLIGIKNNPKFAYNISQLLIGYKIPCAVLCNHLNVFGAFIYNWAARAINLTAFDRLNVAWYAGVELGKVRCCGDWALKVMYQYVEPQAVFQDDLAGISIGNARRTGIYDGAQLENPDTNPLNARGSTNYKGWSVDAAYAMTDDITVRFIFEVASEAVARVGGPQYYERIEMRGIYAF